MMKKSNVLLIVAALLIVASVCVMIVRRKSESPPAPRPAVETNNGSFDWKTAYREFYTNKGYLADVSDGETAPKIALKDLDLNGMPELLVCDPWNAGTYGNGVVYVCAGGKVMSAGISDSYGGQWWPHAISDSAYPGFYTYFWNRGETTENNEMPMHIFYYYLEKNTLKYIDVATDGEEPERYDRLTDDEDLYNAIMNNDIDETIPFTECTDLSVEGWNAFCAQYGF